MNLLKDKAVKNGAVFSLLLQAVMFICPLLLGFIAYKATNSHSAPLWVQLLTYLVCTFGCVPFKKVFSKVSDDRLFVCSYAAVYLMVSIIEAVITLALVLDQDSFLCTMTMSDSLFGGLNTAGFVFFYDFEVCLLPFILGIHDLASKRERLGAEFAVISCIAQSVGNVLFVNLVLFSRVW